MERAIYQTSLSSTPFTSYRVLDFDEDMGFMIRLLRLPVTPAFPKMLSKAHTAMAFTLAVSSLSIGPAAFAQDAAQPAPPPAASAPASSTGSAPSSDATPAPISPNTNADTAASTSTPVGATPLSPETEKTEPAENPYGLKALWKNGDVIARGVLIIMAIMALGTWIILVTKFIEQARLFRNARDAGRTFWNQSSVEQGAQILKADSPFRYIAETGITAAQHHEGSMRDSIDLHSWTAMSIQRAIETINTRLQGGLAFLGTVGSTSPFIGLFGTVWGIYHALTAIGIAGQASIDKVAGPVGESLIMTAIGLATAVPAVLGYNLLVRRNKSAMDRVRNFGSDVHSVLIGGYRHGTAPDFGKSAPSPTTTTTNQRV